MRNDPFRTVMESGRPPVGYLCTATPPEILYAAGAHPFRMTGTGRNQEAAEDLAHPNLCGLCKSAIAWAKALPAETPIRFVAASSCDGCNRLGAIVAGLPAVEAVFPLDIPRTSLPSDLAFFANGLRTLHEKVAAHLGVRADADSLFEAIGFYREARAAFREVLTQVYEGRLPVAAAFEASESYFVDLPDTFTHRAREIAGRAVDAPMTNGPKVIVAGNLTLGAALTQALENAGVRLVGIDLCNVDRAAQIDVQDERDPYRALAEAVYARPLCARFEPGIGWATKIAEQAERTGANGVVLFSLKFCDNTLYAYPSSRRVLEDAGLTVLTLDGEYAPDVSGQILTRIEAFVEML